MDLSALVVWSMLGLKCASHFRFPYASTTPAEFWNSRWNIPVSQAMRAMLYEPIIEGHWIKQEKLETKAESETEIIHKESPRGKKVHELKRKSSPAASTARAADTTKKDKHKHKHSPAVQLRRAGAGLLVFLASGVVHEVMFLSLTGKFTRSLLWLRYFVYWGLIVVAEGALKRPARNMGIRIPRWMTMLGTLLAFNYLTGAMWWKPAEDAGMPQIAMTHVSEIWNMVKGLFEMYVGVFKLQEAED